jgi:hypothetical protein
MYGARSAISTASRSRAAGAFSAGEDAAQERGYFARDLRLDRRGGFISSGVSVSSTGRKVQILSLTSTISPQIYFVLCLVERRLRGKGLCYSLASHPARQAETTEGGKLAVQLSPFRLQSRQRAGHGGRPLFPVFRR